LLPERGTNRSIPLNSHHGIGYPKGIGVLLVEQNARMALKLAQYGYVLESGEIAIEGESEALMHNSDVQRVYLGK